jgi:D-sedoheptulose 7-phosphate isomerase
MTTATRLHELVAQRFQQSIDVPSRFFEQYAGSLAQTCRAMARRFRAGGRLLAFGEHAQGTDAQHVAVEFAHPVIVGKRALPALAITGQIPALLHTLARAGDIALGMDTNGHTMSVVRGLEQARRRGLLTIALAGGDGGALLSRASSEFTFVVPSDDPTIVQEVHETTYHVLWELVHVFLEQPGTL